MTGLSNITPQILTPRDTIAAQANAKQPAAAADPKATASAGTPAAGTGTGELDHSGRIQGPSLASLTAGPGDAPAKGAAGSADGSNESVATKTIKEQIAQIQKQLAAVMQQIQSIQSGNMDERAKANALGGLQAQANTLEGALQQAMGKLAEVLQQEGGSTAGNIVDTTA